MQAIVTKYLPATDTRGSRIKATCDAGTLTLPYPHEINHNDTHAHVARALLAKLGWDARFDIVSGAMPKGAGECHVLVLKSA